MLVWPIGPKFVPAIVTASLPLVATPGLPDASSEKACSFATKPGFSYDVFPLDVAMRPPTETCQK